MSKQPKPPNTQEWVLKPESEYRFELDPGTALAIKVQQFLPPAHSTSNILLQLIQGKAEIFGAELVTGKYYLFGVECKAAVFTWKGGTIEMSELTASTLGSS